MTRRVPGAAFGFLLLMIGHSEAGSRADQEVRRVVGELNGALEHNDVARLDRIWADDYVFVAPSGAVLTKAQRLSAIRSGSFRFEQHRLEECNVRVYGATAVVAGRVVAKGMDHGRDVSGAVRFTSVYVKTRGRWRNVATHTCPIVGDP
jgi:ketosteroid isomerase-like protein